MFHTITLSGRSVGAAGASPVQVMGVSRVSGGEYSSERMPNRPTTAASAPSPSAVPSAMRSRLIFPPDPGRLQPTRPVGSRSMRPTR